MRNALAYFFVFLGIQILTSSIVKSGYTLLTKTPPAEQSPWVTVITMVLFSVIALVVFLRLRWATTSRQYVRSKPWTALVWCVVAAIGAIVPSLFLQGVLPEFPEWAQQMADNADRTMRQLMMMPVGYMVLALLPPVVEELVFRGAILRSLLAWQPQHQWAMIALSALLFAVAHMNPAQIPHAFIIGLLLGWMYMRTGSVVPGIAFHWANNTAVYAMFHIYHNPQTLNDIVGPGTRPVLMAVAFSLCILLPALYQLHLHLKRPRTA